MCDPLFLRSAYQNHHEEHLARASDMFIWSRDARSVLSPSIAVSTFIPFIAAGALGGTIDFMRLKDFSELSSMKPIAIVWLLSAALGDVVITFSISWYLQSHKSGFKQTDQLVDKVIRGESGRISRCLCTHISRPYCTGSYCTKWCVVYELHSQHDCVTCGTGLVTATVATAALILYLASVSP